MTKSNHFHLLQHSDALLQKFQGFSLLCIGHLQLPGMPAGYVPSFSWPKLGIYGIYGTQRIMGKEWDITTRIHVHIYIYTVYIYMVLWCVMVIPFYSQCDHNGYANGVSWWVRWDRDRQEKLDFRRFRADFGQAFMRCFYSPGGGPEMGIHQ